MSDPTHLCYLCDNDYPENKTHKIIYQSDFYNDAVYNMYVCHSCAENAPWSEIEKDLQEHKNNEEYAGGEEQNVKLYIPCSLFDFRNKETRRLS